MSLNAKSILPADLASRAAALSLAANFGLMIIKITVGLITGSLAVLSDGIDSAQDMLAAGIVLASVRIGRRPADPEHTFGHGRAETIAAAIQALMIGVGATYIAFSAVSRLTNPPDQIGTDLGLATMLLAALVNLIVVRYVANAARITRSPAIASDARHLWTNVVQAVAVLTGLGLVALTGEVAFDAILALSLALYLFWTSGRILASAANDILDASLSAEEVRFVEAAILSQGRCHLRIPPASYPPLRPNSAHRLSSSFPILGHDHHCSFDYRKHRSPDQSSLAGRRNPHPRRTRRRIIPFAGRLRKRARLRTEPCRSGCRL